MRGKLAKKKSKFIEYITSPFRIMRLARDLYTKSMLECAGRIGQGSMVACHGLRGSQLPRKLDATTLSKGKKNNVEGVKEVARVVSRRELRSGTGKGCGVGRSSYSIGVGKIGTIYEDKTCEFEEEDVKEKDGVLYPRNRSTCGARKINVLNY